MQNSQNQSIKSNDYKPFEYLRVTLSANGKIMDDLRTKLVRRKTWK